MCPEPLPPAIKEQLSHINTALSSIESLSVDLNVGAERLRGLVKRLAMQADDINGKGTIPTIVYFTVLNNARHLVDRLLQRCMMPSPTGTVLLSLRGLLSEKDDLVRIALVIRVMRYVSFYPWGSIRADGNRKKKMREQVLERLWSSDPFESGTGPFVAGGGVLWTPVFVKGTKFKIASSLTRVSPEVGETVAWLASRQPPMNKRQVNETKMVEVLHIDVTETLKQQVEDMSSGDRKSVV